MLEWDFVELWASWPQRLQGETVNLCSMFNGLVHFCDARCQYKPKPDDLACAASDMFSLGVITFMLVSGGREPFWEGSDVR